MQACKEYVGHVCICVPWVYDVGTVSKRIEHVNQALDNLEYLLLLLSNTMHADKSFANEEKKAEWKFMAAINIDKNTLIARYV